MARIVTQPNDWQLGATDNTIWHVPTGTVFLISDGVRLPHGRWMSLKQFVATPLVVDAQRLSDSELAALRREASQMASDFTLGKSVKLLFEPSVPKAR